MRILIPASFIWRGSLTEIICVASCLLSSFFSVYQSSLNDSTENVRDQIDLPNQTSKKFLRLCELFSGFYKKSIDYCEAITFAAY
jgi:hypothetical protein